MGIFDGMLLEIGTHADAQTIAERLSIPSDRVEEAVAALGVAHSQPGNIIATAAACSGIRGGDLQRVFDQIGGEEALGELANLLGRGTRGNQLFDKLSDLYAD